MDSVSEVLTIEDSNIVEPPAAMGKSRVLKAIGKVGNDVKLLRDTNKLFSELDLITAVNL